ncbi:MAG TPA: hypothetical protein VMV50_02430 [Candidatus Paceibacterota bacterium]|nr:hypothetical protein [Candidatus Paceibacterota bacterium]
MNAIHLRKPLSKEDHPDYASSVEKAVRDGRLLRACARFVVVLDAAGRCIDMVHREKDYIASVACVLGPASVAGTDVPEALLLEVGISRGRPYRSAERKKRNRPMYGRRARKWRISARKPVREIQDAERRTTFRMLQVGFQEMTMHVRSKWKAHSRQAWFIPIGGSGKKGWAQYVEFERGIQLSINDRDAWLRNALLARSGKRYRHWLRHSPTLGPLEDCGVRYLGRGKTHGQECVQLEFFFRREARERLNV